MSSIESIENIESIKRLSFKKKKEVLRAIDGMSKEQWEAIGEEKHCLLEEIRTTFQNQCYRIFLLTITQQKALRKEIDNMTDSQLKAVEQVNELPIDIVKERLDLLISAYNAEAKARREFNKAWKMREKEVTQQLIKEGIITPLLGGAYVINFFPHSERIMKAQVELAKELGLHLRFGNWLTGYMES